MMLKLTAFSVYCANIVLYTADAVLGQLHTMVWQVNWTSSHVVPSVLHLVT